MGSFWRPFWLLRRLGRPKKRKHPPDANSLIQVPLIVPKIAENGPSREAQNRKKTEKNRCRDAVKFYIHFWNDFYMFFGSFWDNFSSFLGRATGSKSEHKPCRFVEPRCSDKQEKNKKNIEASNIKILQITAQDQCFSMFPFCSAWARRCEAASEIHEKIIRRILKNGPEMSKKNRKMRCRSDVFKVRPKNTEKEPQKDTKMEPKWPKKCENSGS